MSDLLTLAIKSGKLYSDDKIPKLITVVARRISWSFSIKTIEMITVANWSFVLKIKEHEGKY